MQRQTTGMSYLLTDKQCIQQITRPRMGKQNASRRATTSLSIVHNYVSAFTTNNSKTSTSVNDDHHFLCNLYFKRLRFKI